MKTLPEAEIRNGIAEILKTSSCTHIDTFQSLKRCGQAFIETRFGQLIEGGQGITTSVVETVVRQIKQIQSPQLLTSA